MEYNDNIFSTVQVMSLCILNYYEQYPDDLMAAWSTVQALHTTTGPTEEQQERQDSEPQVPGVGTQAHSGHTLYRSLVRQLRFRLGFRARPSNSPQQPIEIPRITHPLESCSEIYRKRLLSCELGRPLWIPQSNQTLPPSYQQSGVRIGDVGIVTPEGGFDFLFNIYLDRNDPVNSRVPDDFAPLYPPFDPSDDIIDFPHHHASGTCLTSSQIEHSRENSIVTFSSSATTGAILTLPNGAGLRRLAHPYDPRFLAYINSNAKSWYQFINNIRRRGAQNGDVRVVWGAHKSVAWGMATFWNNPVEQQSKILKFKHSIQNNADAPRYTWDYRGSCSTKVGPEPWRNHDLFIQNQCLFIRSFTITLNPDVWQGILSQINVGGDPLQQSGSNVRLHTRSLSSAVDRPTPTLTPTKNDATIEYDGPPEAVDAIDHSKAIGSLILAKCPKSKVAIVDELDWCTSLRDEDLPNIASSKILTRILAVKDIQSSASGLVCLLPKEEHVTTTEGQSNFNYAVFEPMMNNNTITTSLLEDIPPDLPSPTGLETCLRFEYTSSALRKCLSKQEMPSYATQDFSRLLHFCEYIKHMEARHPILDLPQGLQNVEITSYLHGKLTSTPVSDSFGKAYYSKSIADISMKTHIRLGSLDDLDKAIWYYEKAVSQTASIWMLRRAYCLCLCYALYRRFHIRGALRDLVLLASYLQELTSYHWNRGLSHLKQISKVINPMASKSLDVRALPDGKTYDGHLQSQYTIKTLASLWMSQPKPKFSLLWLNGSSTTIRDVIFHLPSYAQNPSVFISCGSGRGLASTFALVASKLQRKQHLKPVLGLPTERKTLFFDAMTLEFWAHIGLPASQYPSALWSHFPTVIIDALDVDRGCDSQLLTILAVIADVLSRFNIPLRFLIATRRDSRIQNVFERSNVSRQFFVPEMPFNSVQPLTMAVSLNRSLKIDSESAVWHGREEAISTLVARTNYIFDYHRIAALFIGAGHDFEERKKRLKVLSASQPVKNDLMGRNLVQGFKEIDELFSQILLTYPDSDLLVFILGLMVVQYHAADPEILLEDLFNISSETFISIILLLRPVSASNLDHSASLAANAVKDWLIPTFRDFLTNPDRSGRFYVDVNFYHGMLAINGFSFLTRTLSETPIASRPGSHIESMRSSFSENTWGYMENHLLDHFIQSPEHIRYKILSNLEGQMRTVFFHGKDSISKPVQEGLVVIIHTIIRHWDIGVNYFPREPDIDLSSMIHKMRGILFGRAVKIDLKSRTLETKTASPNSVSASTSSEPGSYLLALGALKTARDTPVPSFLKERCTSLIDRCDRLIISARAIQSELPTPLERRLKIVESACIAVRDVTTGVSGRNVAWRLFNKSQIDEDFRSAEALLAMATQFTGIGPSQLNEPYSVSEDMNDSVTGYLRD